MTSTVKPDFSNGVDASDRIIAREEVFDLVLCVLTIDDEDEAVRIANDCEFGLMAGIWTADGGGPCD